MRSLDYMNRVEAYVNRLNSERRTVLETIQQVRFLDLMADEINCADMTADCEEDENKKYGVAPNLQYTQGAMLREVLYWRIAAAGQFFRAQIRGAVRITMGFLLFL